MTNFEKWKAGLMLEIFSKMLHDSESCSTCPTQDDYIKRVTGICRDVFMARANMEADND